MAGSNGLPYRGSHDAADQRCGQCGGRHCGDDPQYFAAGDRTGTGILYAVLLFAAPCGVRPAGGSGGDPLFLVAGEAPEKVTGKGAGERVGVPVLFAGKPGQPSDRQGLYRRGPGGGAADKTAGRTFLLGIPQDRTGNRQLHGDGTGFSGRVSDGLFLRGMAAVQTADHLRHHVGLFNVGEPGAGADSGTGAADSPDHCPADLRREDHGVTADPRGAKGGRGDRRPHDRCGTAGRVLWIYERTGA